MVKSKSELVKDKTKSAFIKELKKPVSLIAIAALLVSLATLVFSIYIQTEQVRLQAEQTRIQNEQTRIQSEQTHKIEENERQQNSKWEAINVGHLEVVTIDFQIFKEIDADKLNKIDWGYKKGFQILSENRKYTDKISIPFALVIWDIEKNSPVMSNHYFTLSEINQAIKQFNLSTSTTETYRKYLIYAEIKNTGNLPTNNCIVSFETNLGKGAQIDKSASNENQSNGIKVLPNKTYSTNFIFYLPLENDLPESINFNITLDYKDSSGNPKKETFYFLYKDGWSPVSSPENIPTVSN